MTARDVTREMNTWVIHTTRWQQGRFCNHHHPIRPLIPPWPQAKFIFSVCVRYKCASVNTLVIWFYVDVWQKYAGSTGTHLHDWRTRCWCAMAPKLQLLEPSLGDSGAVKYWLQYGNDSTPLAQLVSVYMADCSCISLHWRQLSSHYSSLRQTSFLCEMVCSVDVAVRVTKHIICRLHNSW